MDEEKYFSHSWKLLTRDKGWIKPLLVMACADFVPVAGGLGNFGYSLEWARLTAWGVDAAPKQKNVNIGKCIGSGWRGFLVTLGLGLILTIFSGIIGGICSVMPDPVGIAIAVVLDLILFVVSLFYNTFINVACIRAAIYERAGAGYRLDRIFDMIKRDMRGVLKVVVVFLLCQVVLSVCTFFFMAIIAMMAMPTIVAYGVSSDPATALATLAGSMVWIFLVSCIGLFVFCFVNNGCRLITLTATGLWMRQFDVPRWGRSEDPLPEPRPGAQRGTYGASGAARSSEAPERPIARPSHMSADSVISGPQNASEEVQNKPAETTGDIFTSDYDEIRTQALEDAPEEASTSTLLAALSDLTDDQDDE